MNKRIDPLINRNQIAVSLRKDLSEIKHSSNKRPATFLSDPRIKQWKHWILIENSFPYDMAFSMHHLLMPIREVAEPDLSKQEKQELESILDELSGDYDSRLINYPAKQSVRHHFHIHMLVYKKNRADLVF